MQQVELKPHNQTTYNTLNEMLESTHRVACVQPTGTGKSYLALRFILLFIFSIIIDNARTYMDLFFYAKIQSPIH